MTVPSLFYAIFKRLQATYWSDPGYSTSSLHFATSPSQLLGGFSLSTPSDPNGLLGKLASGAPPPVMAGTSPLSALNDPQLSDCPLYMMLSTSLPGPNMPSNTDTVPLKVNVNGVDWPTMPPPQALTQGATTGQQYNQVWLNFNMGTPPPLVTAFGQWVLGPRWDDSPKGALSLPALTQLPQPAFPNIKTALLFVASFMGDNGQRPGDHENPPVQTNPVPPHWWATSPMVLCSQVDGSVQTPNTLPANEEYVLAAVVGNSGNGPAGTAANNVPVTVNAWAACFGSFLSPTVALPAMSNLDAGSNPDYEAFWLQGGTYDTVGFRFNVQNVFDELANQLNQVDSSKLGMSSAEQWLKDGHPCVWVTISGGEQPNTFPPATPNADPPVPGVTIPAFNRHIAQHNLAPFDPSTVAMKKPRWVNFIMSQAGAGTNTLTIKAEGWPSISEGRDDVHYWFAMPSAFYERYVAKTGHRGFEAQREGVPKPFPDCVMLRQTTPGARLTILDHGHRDWFGMAIGIEGDGSRLARARLGDIAVVHRAHDGATVGGFSLRPVRPS